MGKQKTDYVGELSALVRQVKSQPDTAQRPNKWRTMWVKDVGAMLTRYNNVSKKLQAAESKIKSLTE